MARKVVAKPVKKAKKIAKSVAKKPKARKGKSAPKAKPAKEAVPPKQEDFEHNDDAEFPPFEEVGTDDCEESELGFDESDIEDLYEEDEEGGVCR